jgi:protein-S-isoprenylcysteine O-methyltransferase
MTLIVIFIPIVISFLKRIRVEEKVLSEAFGRQYKDYIQKTWRLIPGVF